MDMKKSTSKSFSLRALSRRAGFSSFSLLPMILKGKRKISSDTLNKLIIVLKLKKKEAEYFEAMIMLNHAKDDQQRDRYFEKLRNIRPKIKVSELDQNQYDLFTKSFYGIIHQMVLLDDFEEDHEWIANRIFPPIKPLEAKEAISILIKLKLLKRNKEGKLEHTSKSIKTPNTVGTFEVYQYQYQMLIGAKKALVNLPANYRDVTSVMIPIPKSKMKEFKDKIASFREEIVDWISSNPTTRDEVYQLNIQLFPHTLKRK